MSYYFFRTTPFSIQHKQNLEFLADAIIVGGKKTLRECVVIGEGGLLSLEAECSPVFSIVKMHPIIQLLELGSSVGREANLHNAEVSLSAVLSILGSPDGSVTCTEFAVHTLTGADSSPSAKTAVELIYSKAIHFPTLNLVNAEADYFQERVLVPTKEVSGLKPTTEGELMEIIYTNERA